MSNKSKELEDFQLSQATELISGHEINTADAAAISEMTYTIYKVVPHSSNDKNLFCINDIEVHQPLGGGDLYLSIGQPQTEKPSLIPQKQSLSKFSQNAYYDGVAKKHLDHQIQINPQQKMLDILNQKMAAEPEFAETMQNHFKSLKNLQDRGFKLTNYTFDPESHHGGMTFWHEPTKSLMFGHRGSEASDWVGIAKDWLKTDGLEILTMGKRLSKADEAALRYVDHQFNEQAAKHPDLKNVFETGHSKGGRESQNAAMYLANKVKNYIAMREVAFEKKLSHLKAPENITVTALTFNSARIRTVTRLVEWANKMGDNNFVTKAFSNTLRYVSSHLEKRLNDRINHLQANDASVVAMRENQLHDELASKIKTVSESRVQLKHVNISYADINGKNADPVSNFTYGLGHLGRDVVIKHPQVKSIIDTHSLKRTHELVRRVSNGQESPDFNLVFSKMPINTLVDAVDNLPNFQSNTKANVFHVEELNQACLVLKSKMQITNDQKEVFLTNENFENTSPPQKQQMNPLEHLRMMRQTANVITPKLESDNHYDNGPKPF